VRCNTGKRSLTFQVLKIEYVLYLFLKLLRIVASLQLLWTLNVHGVFVSMFFLLNSLLFFTHQHRLHVQELATVLASMIDIRDKVQNEKEQLSQRCNF
jgi:hypothetical protein